MTNTNPQNKPLFEFNTPYIFYKCNKNKMDMKIKLIITKITKSFIYYNYNESNHPVISTKSKLRCFDDDTLIFIIKNKHYTYSQIWVHFFKDYLTNPRRHGYANLTKRTRNKMMLSSSPRFPFVYPFRFVVKSDIRRYVDNLRKRINAKKIIVAYWCRARYNPEYKIGRKYCMDNYYQDILGIPPPPNKPLPAIPVY